MILLKGIVYGLIWLLGVHGGLVYLPSLLIGSLIGEGASYAWNITLASLVPVIPPVAIACFRNSGGNRLMPYLMTGWVAGALLSAIAVLVDRAQDLSLETAVLLVAGGAFLIAAFMALNDWIKDRQYRRQAA